MLKKERAIELAIIEYINLIPGAAAFKVETRGAWDAKRGFYRKQQGIIKGTHDIIGLYCGVFFSFEVKRPANLDGDANSKTYPTKEQKAFLQMVRKNGGVSFVIRSVEEARLAMVWIKNNKILQKSDKLKGTDIYGD